MYQAQVLSAMSTVYPSKKHNAPIWVEGKIQCLQLRLPQEHPKQNAQKAIQERIKL